MAELTENMVPYEGLPDDYKLAMYEAAPILALFGVDVTDRGTLMLAYPQMNLYDLDEIDVLDAHWPEEEG